MHLSALMNLKSRIIIVALAFCALLNTAKGQSDNDFLPQVKLLAIDSTEHAAVRFCKEVMQAVPGYSQAFIDREDIFMSKYVYENGSYETLKFAFQFTINEVVMPDSTKGKKRVVKLQRITAELSAMANIYNYLFNTNHSPDKIMAISRYDKDIAYNGTAYICSIIADDYKPGYWVLTIYRL